MSWTRAELKARGKAAFYKNYWVCVLVSFILCMVGGSSNNVSCNTGSSSSGSSYSSNYDYDYDDYDYNYGDYGDYGDFDDDYGSDASDIVNTGVFAILGAFTVAIIVICLIAGVIGLLLSAFVFNPFQVGGCYFFLENAVSDNASIGGLIAGFKSNYKGTVITMFLRNLYIGLWTMLLIVPGIIKSYEYRMIPYILADHPEMDHKEAFALSKKMMDGEKMNAFILDWSFFGWALLSTLTCGILSIFFVNPYVNATNAELYLALKRSKCQSTYDGYGNAYSNYDNSTTYSSYDNTNPYTSNDSTNPYTSYDSTSPYTSYDSTSPYTSSDSTSPYSSYDNTTTYGDSTNTDNPTNF